MNGETVAENDRHIYLIASDYLKYDYVPTKTKDEAEYEMYKNSDYRLSFNSMYNAYTGSADITDARITKWMKWVGQYKSSTNINIRSIAYMLDAEIWNTRYKNNYADYAVGGTTLELLCASYKATHQSRYIECGIMPANGYRVKWSDGSDSFYIEGLDTSELENLYVISDPNKAYAYWIASPSAGGESRLLFVSYDGLLRNYYYNYDEPGLRPIICLKSNTKLVPNGDTYDLSI